MPARPGAIHRAGDRGRTTNDWLDSRHSFSFGSWHAPDRMVIPPLNALNVDVVAPGAGFESRAHRGAAILTYVLQGTLHHEDDAGNACALQGGDAQVLRPGRGVVHSELNGSRDEPVRLLQAWIEPRSSGAPPAYGHLRVPLDHDGTWTTLARDQRRRPDALHSRGEGVPVDADIVVVAARLAAEDRTFYPLAPRRLAYLFCIEGAVQVADVDLGAGDAVLLEGDEVVVDAAEASHLVLFDLPAG